MFADQVYQVMREILRPSFALCSFLAPGSNRDQSAIKGPVSDDQPTAFLLPHIPRLTLARSGPYKRPFQIFILPEQQTCGLLRIYRHPLTLAGRRCKYGRLCSTQHQRRGSKRVGLYSPFLMVVATLTHLFDIDTHTDTDSVTRQSHTPAPSINIIPKHQIKQTSRISEAPLFP